MAVVEVVAVIVVKVEVALIVTIVAAVVQY